MANTIFLLDELMHTRLSLFTPTNKPIIRYITWFFLINTPLFWLIGFGYFKSMLFNNGAVSYFSGFQKGLECFLSVVTYLNVMMLFTFVLGIIVFILAIILPNKRLIWFLSVLITVFAIILLVMDSQVYSMFRFHLSHTLFAFILSDQWHTVFDFSPLELFEITSLFGVIVILECCIAFLIWKKIVMGARFLFDKIVVIFWLGWVLFGLFLLFISISKQGSLLNQELSALPLLNQLLQLVLPSNAGNNLLRSTEGGFAQPMYSNEPLLYPRHPMRCRAPTSPYNFIIIEVDSLRFDSLQAHYMPNVTRFAATSWQFTKYLSGGNATQAGLFSLFYSIPVNYWTAVLHQKKQSVFMSLLQEYGYIMRIIWSSPITVPPFDKTIFIGLLNHELFSGQGKQDIGENDRQVTKHTIDFLSTPQKKPFFIHLFYNAAHGYCANQSFPILYKPIMKQCTRLIDLNNDTPPLPYYNRYLNAVTFIDNEIAQVLKCIEKKGYLKNSVIIVTSDHGQEFNDNHNNYWEHASNYTDTQTHVPFVIHWPGKSPHHFNYVTSAYDLVPTILKRLFSCQNPVSDYSIGHNLLKEQGRLPFVLGGSYASIGIIEPHQLTTLYTSGTITITDKHTFPIRNAQPNPFIMKKALSFMRRFFEPVP